jgi:hypothetical protein
MVSLKYVAVELRGHPYFIHDVEACGPAVWKPDTKIKIKIKKIHVTKFHP